VFDRNYRPPEQDPLSRITSRTRLFAVIGDPVAHSLSPRLQNALFRHFGLGGAYLALRVAPGALADAIVGARALGIAGLNVTIPHKAAVVPWCDARTAEVDLLGVANTLAFREGRIEAYNTDAAGFAASLGAEAGRFRQGKVVLLGAGGAARAVVFALSRLGAAQLTVVNRSLQRAEDLIGFCRDNLGFSDLLAITPDDPRLSETLRGAEIIINATPAGMHPDIDAAPLHDFSMLSRRHLVYDLIYNPLATRFMKEAEARGARILGGLDMLIFQGLAALNIWYGSDFRLEITEVDELRTLLMRELQ